MANATELQRENSEGAEKRLLNLRPFRKGISGNPGGRPKGSSVSAAIKRLVADGNTAEEIAKVIVGKALDGEIDFVRLLLDRAEGGVMKQIQVSAPKPPEEMTNEELKAALAEILLEHGEHPQALEDAETHTTCLQHNFAAIEAEGEGAQAVALNSAT